LTPHFDKKILAVLLEWDYGIRSRGVSCEKLWFFDNLRHLAPSTEAFWYDEYLKKTRMLQRALVEKAAGLRPDLIFFVPYTDQFSFETLDTLKTIAPTLAWFGDDTWRFESFSKRYAPHFTHVATTDPLSIPGYRSIGIEPILTEWAGQISSVDLGIPPPDASCEHEVSFVGGRNEYRGWLIGQLKRSGVEVACFGAGWPKGRISFEEMEQVFRGSRINLNISNSVKTDVRFAVAGPRNLAVYLRSPKRAEQVKARNFEIPLCGGFQLTDYAIGLERHFVIGREVAIFNTPEECARQIRYYLNNESERREVLEAGYLRASAEHTFRKRLSDILHRLWGPPY